MTSPAANSRGWLDPTKTSEAIAHPDPPSEQLPPEVRSFGFIPTFDSLRPGDVLLVSAVKPPLVSRAIASIQKKAGFADIHAQWHHAAVYVGNHMVCEAQLWRVRTASIFKYAAGTHRLRFRRDPQMTELLSCRLALEATLKLNYGYSWRSVVKLLFQARIGWNRGADKPRTLGDRTTFCSQLYADAYGVVTETTLDSRAESGVSPAHLSVNKTLRDIPMLWLRLRPPEPSEPGQQPEALAAPDAAAGAAPAASVVTAGPKPVS